MSRKTADRSTFVVTGASRGYGAEIAACLRTAHKQRVFEIQRHPRPDLVDNPRFAGAGIADFIGCDFFEAENGVQAVSRLHSAMKGEKIAGIVHAVGFKEIIDPGLLTVLDISQHLMANVLGPAMFTVYCSQYGVLAESAPVAWLLDRRRIKADYAAYRSAKNAIPGIVDPLGELHCGRNCFILTPDKETPNGDMLADRVAKLMMGEIEYKKMLDFVV